MTAEDPVEIELEGIIQTQVNPQIGLDLADYFVHFYDRPRHYYAW